MKERIKNHYRKNEDNIKDLAIATGAVLTIVGAMLLAVRKGESNKYIEEVRGFTTDDGREHIQVIARDGSFRGFTKRLPETV